MFGLGPMELILVLFPLALFSLIPVLLLVFLFKISGRLKNIENMLNKNKISSESTRKV